MFDGRFRAEAERTLKPVGAQLKRTGITADHLTVLGIVMAALASVSIANGALQLGLLFGVLAALPDVLDGAVAKASGTASSRGAFFDSVADRFTDALFLLGIAWYLSGDGGRIALLPMAVPAVQPAPDPDPVGDVGADPGHRGPAVRQGLAAGQRRGSGPCDS